MESRKFEDAFKDAFQEAEVNPSDNVWTNVELDLEKANGGKMKRRLLFYQLLAAASVAFAMSVAGVGYFVVSQNPTHDVIASSDQHDAAVSPRGNETNSSEAQSPVGSSSPAKEAQQSIASSHQDATDNQASGQENELEKAGVVTDKSTASNKIASSEKPAGQATEVSTTDKNTRTVKESNANTKKRPIQNAGVSEQSGDRDARVAQQVPPVQTTPNENSLATNDASNPASPVDTNTRTNDPLQANNDVKNARSDSYAAQQGSTSSSASSSVAKSNENQVVGLPANDDQQSLADASYPVSKLAARVGRPASFAADNSTAEIDPFKKMMIDLERREKELQNEEKKEKDSKIDAEKLWTSVGFAAGGFSTVNSSVSSSATSLAFNNVADQQAKASGVAYSVGVSVGTKISERWVLQGGVNYMTQASDYTAHALGASSDFKTFSAPSVNNISSADNTLVPSASYNVNNNAQFVSIPVQAGYLLVNKKFGIQLNGGVSTDLFIQNTITPDSDKLEKTTQGRGEDSPYRTVNFSGLVGSEFSYRLGTRYRLALNPGLRYSLNSIYKSDQPIEAMPLTFDVGLKFRYIFR